MDLHAVARALEEHELPEHAPEAQLRAVTRVAAALTGTSTAVVNLLDDCFQHQVAACGFDGGTTPVSASMCAVALQDARLRHVPDARLEPAFAGNPWVDGTLAEVRSYASAPLVLPDGRVLGSLCVFDEEPRELSPAQRDALTDLAGQAVALIRSARAAREAVRAEALTRTVLDTMSVGVVACDAEGRLSLFNDAARRFHGLGADPDLPHAQWAARYGLHVEDGTRLLAPEEVPLRRALVAGSVSGQMVVIAADGQPLRTVVCDGRAMHDAEGVLLGALVTMKDVSALRRSEQRFRAAFYDGPTPLARLTEDGALLEVNPALCRLVGRDAAALSGAPLGQHVHEQDAAALAAAVAGRSGGELRVLRADGAVRWCEIGCTLGTEPDGTRTVLLQLLDVTERRAAAAVLERAARTDGLTGLPNRAALDAHLRTRRRDRNGLVFVDLDGFKAVNDTHGHEAGDAVLVEVGARLRRAVRGGDLVARLGGDEFVVVSADVVEPGPLAALATRLEAALDAPFAWRGLELGCRASVGVQAGALGDDPRVLLARADQRMYARKAERRAAVPAQREPDALRARSDSSIRRPVTMSAEAASSASAAADHAAG